MLSVCIADDEMRAEAYRGEQYWTPWLWKTRRSSTGCPASIRALHIKVYGIIVRVLCFVGVGGVPLGFGSLVLGKALPSFAKVSLPLPSPLFSPQIRLQMPLHYSCHFIIVRCFFLIWIRKCIFRFCFWLIMCGLKYKLMGHRSLVMPLFFPMSF